MNPLKTVMAAVLAAFAVMPAVPAAAAEIKAAPVTRPVKSKGENRDVNLLASLIKKDKQAQTDVSERILHLLMDPDLQGRSYVTDDLRKDPQAKTIPALVAKWVEQHPGDAAWVYYVARPLDGKVPEWGKDVFKDGKDSTTLPERLGNYLAGTDQVHPAGSQIGTIAVSGMADSVSKFLLEAAKGAVTVLKPGVPKTPEEVRRQTEQNDTTASQPPIGRPGTGGSPLTGGSTRFGFKALYEDGALVADLAGPKDGAPRKLSVKMYTIPDGKGHFENKIGIVDIEDRESPYGPKFVELKRGETTFELRPNGRKYSLSIDEKGVVVIKRPEGAGASTSLQTLAKDRLDQLSRSGSVDIGGKAYYVLGQGGTKGALTFFAKDEVDGRRPPYAVEARAMADVSEVAAGHTRPISGKPDLGKVDGKPAHLEFELRNDPTCADQGILGPECGVWKVMPGPGDPPPAPPKEPVPGKPGEPGKPGQPGGGGGKEQTLEEVITFFKNAGYEEPEPDGNEGFSGDIRNSVHILVNPKIEPHMCFFFAPGIAKGNQYCPGRRDGEKLDRLRGAGEYGVVEYSTTKEFFSLESFGNATPAGTYGKTGMMDVSNIEVALMMLKAYEKFPDDKLKVIAARLVKHSKGEYRISGNREKKTIAIFNETENRTCPIWPAEGKCGEGDNRGMTELQGPGTVVDLSFGPDAEFQKELPFDVTQKMALQKVSSDGGTALYLLDDAESGEKKWFAVTRVTVDGKPSRSGKVQIFGTGKDWNALPSAYALQGYASTEVPRNAKLGMVLGEEGAQGALCLYRYAIPAKDGSNVKDKKGNAVGPVVTWGSGDHAAACRTGAF